ncbi:hypothetical protein BTR23_08880 [Alkalihalophilus pseudofirmus]|nr:hypothetical protein BTR23_08880 [Alkalihalophilus pseudofirmus]
MEKTTLVIQPSFYTESPYAKYIMSEENDNSYGLIYYEFLHEIGMILEADIIFDHSSEKDWIIADNQHMQITYNKDGQNNDHFDFIPKTSEGKELIIKMQEQLLQENHKFITLH